MRNRRSVTTLFLTGVLLILAACSKPSTPAAAQPGAAKPTDSKPADGKSFAGQVLRVATWGGDWTDNEELSRAKPLAAATGATVQYTTGNPQDHRAKLIAAKGGPAPFDLIGVTTFEVAQMAKAGLLEPIDYSRIRVANDLAPVAKEKYGVAFLMMEMGITYREEKLKELGVAPPTSIMDLFNPKLAGRVAFPALDTAMGIPGMAALAVANGGNESNMTPSFAALKKMDVLYHYRSSADLASKFTAGDVAVAFWQNSRAFRLQSQVPDVKFARVKMGNKVGIPDFDLYVIPKGAKNIDLAYEYINYALDMKAQMHFAEWGLLTPVNLKAQEEVRTKPALAATMPLDKADLDNYYYVDFTIAEREYDNWLDQWNAATAK